MSISAVKADDPSRVPLDAAPLRPDDLLVSPRAQVLADAAAVSAVRRVARAGGTGRRMRDALLVAAALLGAMLIFFSCFVLQRPALHATAGPRDGEARHRPEGLQ